MAHIRQSIPVSGLDLQVKVVKYFKMLPPRSEVALKRDGHSSDGRRVTDEQLRFRASDNTHRGLLMRAGLGSPT